MTTELVTLCTAGDFATEFGDDEMARVEMALMVEDMLRKGYALFLEVDGETERIHGYDPETDEFVYRRDRREGTSRIKVVTAQDADVSNALESPVAKRGRGRPPKAEKPKSQKSTNGRRKVTAVAPTAGG